VTEKREKTGKKGVQRKRSEEGRRKSGLKAGHVRAKNECDRTYVSAFDRIRAECVSVKWALHSNVQGMFNHMHAGVCV
jgi:hypothetical protein